MGSVASTPALINRAELDSQLTASAKRAWKFHDESDFTRQIQSDEAENYKRIANKMLDYFKEHNQTLLTPSSEYEGEIVWYYSGKDKYDGKFISGETSMVPKKSSMLENLAGNGITPRNIYPKNIADYVINHTNMEPDVLRVADVITTQALKEFKARRKK